MRIAYIALLTALGILAAAAVADALAMPWVRLFGG